MTVHRPPSAPLSAALLRHAAPAAPAVQGDTLQLSAAQLGWRVERAAARLHASWRLQPGDRVAYLGANEPDFITLLLACAETGVIAAPLNVRLAPPEWRAVLGDCTPRLLLHDAAHATAAQALAAAGGPPAQPLSSLIATPAPPLDLPAAAADAPVLLVYTSGTTGRPKGALHTQANLLANIDAAVAAQQLGAHDRVLTCLPLFHVGGLCIQTLPALSVGAAVRLHARFDAAAWLRDVQQWRPTLSLLVPAVMRALVTHPAWASADLSSLRAVWAGSSPLPPDLIDAFHARGVSVCNVYGATETGPFSIALGAGHARTHVGSCGWPALKVEVQLHDAAAPAAASAPVGEVWLRAPHVVQRYWPSTPSCDASGWFHTGDVAERAADGSYRVVGRVKDMIISGGENIYPAEIEHVIAAHPDVAEVAVLGIPDPQWGEVALACVVRRPGAALDEAALRSALQASLQARLARYKQPRQWLFIDALPKTALGKVRKDALRVLVSTS
ncbi:MAG: AMP-binding protein [Betaproteobacteria bacterium]|nr:AMP-binding protein [Betaproteobacteria bacterium]